MRPRLTLALALIALWLAAMPARAQSVPLPRFIARVAALWATGDADGLAALAAPGEPIFLDLGRGQQGEAATRQAAVALRALFDARRTQSVQIGRVTMSGGAPPSGFGELRWEARVDGVADARRATVFVAATWDGRAWRLRQLRVLG